MTWDMLFVPFIYLKEKEGGYGNGKEMLLV